MSWPHRWHLKHTRLSAPGFPDGLHRRGILTNIPRVKRGEDGADGKEVVVLVQGHLGGVRSRRMQSRAQVKTAARGLLLG